jgi:hypothetical protein
MSVVIVNPLLVKFEVLLGHGSVDTAKVLGVGYSTYAGWRSNNRKLPRYIKHSILAMAQLDEFQLDVFAHKMIATWDTLKPKNDETEL